MRPTLIRSVVFASCISLAGCTTLTPSPWGSKSRSAPATQAAGDLGEMVGAFVVVRTVDGKEIEARVTSIDDHRIEVIQTTGESMTLARDNVASLSRKEVNFGRTALLIAGVVVVAYLVTGYVIVKAARKVYP